jgi:hypothetical protein
MKHELHIDPTYAPLPEDEQIDRIVWQQPPALVDRVPLPVLEVFVGLIILVIAYEAFAFYMQFALPR